jgi:hypothetical protein
MTTNANVIARDKAVVRAYYELDERERVRRRAAVAQRSVAGWQVHLQWQMGRAVR